MIQAAFNAFSVPDLRRKLLFTLGLLVVFRIEAHIPVPNVNHGRADRGPQRQQPAADAQPLQRGIAADLLDRGDGSLSLHHRLDRDAAPGADHPPIGRAQQGRGIRPQQDQPVHAHAHRAAGADPGLWADAGAQQLRDGQRGQRLGVHRLRAVQLQDLLAHHHGAALAGSGTVFAMWLGELITENGVGNGISLIIFAGIVARLPVLLGQQITAGNILFLILMGIIAAFVVFCIVFMSEGQRRIPVQYAKRIRGGTDVPGPEHAHPLTGELRGHDPVDLRGIDRDPAGDGLDLVSW